MCSALMKRPYDVSNWSLWQLLKPSSSQQRAERGRKVGARKAGRVTGMWETVDVCADATVFVDHERVNDGDGRVILMQSR